MRAIAVIVASCLLLLVSATVASAGYRERNTAIIHKVFGRYGHQAVRVARCESGLTVGATNGQYLGLFQMG